MSSFTAEELLTESVKYLMEDEVCLDTAMRNLIAKVFGIYSTQDRSVSFSKNNSPDIVYKDIMTSARFILQAFNSHSLIPYEEWAEANSQLEDTTADSRFKQLIDYKGAHYLRTKFEGKKLSKALGRRYLQATNLWDAVVLPAAQAAAAQSNVESNVFLFFSTEFGLSLQDAYVDADLVWSSDFQKTLMQKQVKRAQAEKEAQGKITQTRIPAVEEEGM